MKILTVVGARPQFVKAAAVSRRLGEFAGSGVEEQIVHTGQHYDPGMSEVFFRELEIPHPRWNLSAGLIAGHGEQMGAMISGIDKTLTEYAPDCVLIYGDTNSTLAGAIAASKAGLKLAHVEAGLRSFRRGMQEEVNRVIADRVSDYLFCPTEISVGNLKSEGRIKDVFLVGDVMFDVFNRNKHLVEPQVSMRYKLEPNNYLLATIHRAENTENGNRLSCIFKALNLVSRELPVLLPLHPRTRKAIAAEGIDCADNVKIVEPVSYRELVSLLLSASAVATDSGGMQKEAYFACKPCVTLRDETEWIETIAQGWNCLAPPSSEPASVEAIYRSIISAITVPPSTVPAAIYGDGDAAGKIVQILLENL